MQRAYNAGNTYETWYTRDANGQLTAIYTKDQGGTVTQSEIPIYGDRRLAMAKVDFTNNQRNLTYAYELKDHVGSVRNVIIKDPNQPEGIKTTYAVDYYPYGYKLRKYDQFGVSSQDSLYDKPEICNKKSIPCLNYFKSVT